MPDRARCPYCVQDVTVTKIDTIKTHNYNGERCVGSGMSALGYFHG